jgi:hypothetical protein
VQVQTWYITEQIVCSFLNISLHQDHLLLFVNYLAMCILTSMEQDNNTMTGNDILKQEAFVFEKVVVDIHCKPVLPGVHYKQKLKNNSFVLLY